MVKIIASYEGQLSCTATHEPSGTAITTDAPKDNQGLGRSFSPTDTVASALVTCAMTTMGIVAQRDGIALGKMEGQVVKNMVATPHRRIGSLPIVLTIHGKYSEEEKRKLEHTAKNCPVARSLHPDVELPIEFTYTDEA